MILHIALKLLMRCHPNLLGTMKREARHRYREIYSFGIILR